MSLCASETMYSRSQKLVPVMLLQHSGPPLQAEHAQILLRYVQSGSGDWIRIKRMMSYTLHYDFIEILFSADL